MPQATATPPPPDRFSIEPVSEKHFAGLRAALDVVPCRGEARSHVGTLGIGLVPSVRHKGIGARLMRAAIEKAWANGLTRIDLTVRADNANAMALYERLGFQVEGLLRNAFCVDDEYSDSYAMALLAPRVNK